MSEKIKTEIVDHIDAPPRARVQDATAPAATPTADASTPRSADAQPDAAPSRQRDYLDGFLAKRPDATPGHEPGGDLHAAIIAALKEIYDPEIPVNIYDLGLIYNVDVSDDGHATVTMTLTTPHCPVAESMPGEVELRVGSVPGVGLVDVHLVWDPPWDSSKMTDEARLELGML